MITASDGDRACTHEPTPIRDEVVHELVQAASDVLRAESRYLLHLLLQPLNLPFDVVWLEQRKSEELSQEVRYLVMQRLA